MKEKIRLNSISLISPCLPSLSRPSPHPPIEPESNLKAPYGTLHRIHLYTEIVEEWEIMVNNIILNDRVLANFEVRIPRRKVH